MAKELPPGWAYQSYRFEVDRPGRHPAISSHEGARRFAWNYMLGVIEDQRRVKEAFRVLALRQGARQDEAEAWAKEACWSSYLRELNEKRKKDHEAKVASGQRKPGRYRPVSEWCPWSAEAMRYVWNRVKDEVAPWWAENSKECYSSAFEALSRAFKDHFASLDGTRKGHYVGWPRYKRRSVRQSVGFTTGAIAVADRHHVQLPVIGVLRVKEQTDKLRLKVAAGEARVTRATLVSEGSKTYVSFLAAVKSGAPAAPAKGACGHDVGISALATSSDGSVTKNPRAEQQARKKVSRYQRKMGRQHRSGSPRCFNPDGTHVAGACYWEERSKRAAETRARLAKAHAKAARVRKDIVHKASHRSATSYGVNVVEDLGVSQMGRRGPGKRGFNRAMHDAVLAEHRRQLSYKCPKYGSSLWLAARWYASSKICSNCKTKKPKLSRSTRVFHCDACGLKMGRDLNAAKNLAALAELAFLCLLAQLTTGTPVDWSHLPVRPDGWEAASTRSPRGGARARGSAPVAGGESKTARAHKDGDSSFDREAASHLPSSVTATASAEVA